MHPFIQWLATTLVTLGIGLTIDVQERLEKGSFNIAVNGFWSHVFYPILIVAAAIFIAVILTLILVLKSQMNEASLMMRGADGGDSQMYRVPSFGDDPFDNDDEGRDRWSSQRSSSFADVSKLPPPPMLDQNWDQEESFGVMSRDRTPSLAQALDKVRESFTSVSRQFECPVCLEIMRPPTKMLHCKNGHVLCMTCVENGGITSCPSCRQPLLGRNFTMEKLAEEYFVMV